MGDFEGLYRVPKLSNGVPQSLVDHQKEFGVDGYIVPIAPSLRRKR